MSRRWRLCVGVLVLTAAGSMLYLARHSDGPDHLSLVRIQLEVLGTGVDNFRHDTGRAPVDLQELTLAGGQGPYAKAADLVDPWGARFYYQPSAGSRRYVLFTLGSDGRLGGRGSAADLEYSGSGLGD